MEQAQSNGFRVQDYLPFLDPLISKWFNEKYSELTEPQIKAIPIIHRRENVLVSSPTGTGKTLTGFLSVINEMFSLSRENKLEDRIYCLYISPLKALANDINKNLNAPLQEISELATREGVDVPRIRAAVRSGDTPQNERQKMLRKPPHILITTPESFSLALSAPKFREKLQDLRYVVVDEIHEISATKRGALLSVNLERLAAVNKGFVRIGLSATQAPLELIATYLCGFENGKPRPYRIVEVDTKKFLDLRTITPVSDLTKTSYDVANDRMYDLLVNMINEHKTTLVFTNTRSGTEHVAMRLKARGIESIEAHHSSLGKETRIEVENKLKNGELKCVITSTSLELGIDIGYIDLVVQIGSPKSVSKGLQRIGRSGHGINELSKGRFLVFDLDDLMECSVLTKAAYDREIDKVVIPTNSLDVLSQVLVGMSLEKVWKVDEAYDIIRGSYSFHDLPKSDYIETLNYLSGRIEDNAIYSKIWFDEEEQTFGKKKSTRMIYFMNVGTIPEEADYQVINDKGRHLGQLSDKFVERLKQGDVFVLGAKTYTFLKSSRNRVYVRDATGMRPTVPSWTGEMLPRSFDLGVLVGKFRKTAIEKIEAGEDVKKWLMEDYRLDQNGANSLISYIKTQSKFDIPTDDHLLAEGYNDSEGLFSIIFHIPLGRRINDALSRAYGQLMANKYSVNTRITITDDGFILTSQKKVQIKEAVSLLNSSNFEETVARSISNTEVFKQRFRHCAARSLMVLRKYKGYDISVVRQQLRSDKLLKTLEGMKSFPVIKEAYHEIMNDMMDVPRALDYVKEVIETKQYRILEYKAETSPFSYGLILAGVSDMVLMEDRSKLLKELQGRILDKIYGADEIRFLIQDQKSVDDYYRSKVPVVTDLQSYENLARHFLVLDPFRNRFNSPFPYSSEGVSDLTETLISEDVLVSVYVRGTIWCHIDNYGAIRTLFQSEYKLDHASQTVLDACQDLTFSELKRALSMEDTQLKDVLNRLESSYLIRRKLKEGVVVYGKNDLYHEPVGFSEAIEKAIILVIGSYGPLTMDELSIRLPVEQELLVPALENLVTSEVMINDYITPVFAKQYILKQDLDALLGRGKSNELELRILDFCKQVDSVAEYFEKYGYAYDLTNIRSRVVNFYEDELQELIEKGDVKFGRFIKHKFSYVSRWMADSLYDLRYEAFKEEELQILSLISSGISGEDELSRRSGLPIKLLKQIIKSLEFRLSVSRDNGGKLQLFKGSASPVEIKTSLTTLMNKYGPISRKELSHNFWIYLDNIIKLIEIKPSYIKDDLYYGSRKLQVTGRENAIVPVSDTLELYLGRKYLNEIDYNSVYVSNGKETASLNLEVKQDTLWIDDLVGNIDDSAAFFSLLLDLKEKYGCTEIFVKNVPVELISGATSLGFTEKSGSLIFGDAEIIDMSEESLFTYAVANTQINDGSVVFETLNEYILGIRNEVEASYMGLRNALLRNYFQSKLLFYFNGPYETQTMGTLETISVYRALKSRNLSEEDQRVVHTIMELGGATETEIIAHLRKDVFGTKNTLKSLYSDCILAKDSDRRYIFVPEKYRRIEAVETIIKVLLKNFGFLDTQRYSDVTGRNPDHDFYKVMNSLIKSKQVIKGIIPGVKRLIYLNPVSLKYRKYEEQSRIMIPKDIIILYFSDFIKQQMGSTNLYIFVEEGKIAAGFSARKSLKTLKVSKILGDRNYRERLRKEMNDFGFAVSFT
ncbi:MAG: ATP-dependent helicase [Thermoplasmatales archaeon]|nr:ATP-dependent helicase [Thermoplasmatales archaeon]